MRLYNQETVPMSPDLSLHGDLGLGTRLAWRRLRKVWLIIPLCDRIFGTSGALRTGPTHFLIEELGAVLDFNIITPSLNH